MKKIVILVIEDEASIRDMLRFALEPAGFTVIEADCSDRVHTEIAHCIPDLILLDWMLPGSSGIELAKQLKQQSTTQNIPIIMLTAKAEENNKLKGFAAGIDDYVTKPFSPRELIARIKTILRRGPIVSPQDIIRVQQLTLDVNKHQVFVADQIIELTPIEYRLLYFFLTHQNRVYDREQLLTNVWGADVYHNERTVDVQIRRLRNRLKKYKYDTLLQTVRGSGYQFGTKHEY